MIDPKPLRGEREFSVAPIVRNYLLGHSRRDVVRRDRPPARAVAVEVELRGEAVEPAEPVRWLRAA